MSRFASLLVLLVLLVLAGTAPAQGKPEPLVKQVKTAINQAVTFLTDKQAGDGSWDNVSTEGGVYQGGTTALAVLALMQCEEIRDDPALEQKRKKSIERGLDNLRKIDSPRVYVIALQTMALAEGRNSRDRELIKRNVKKLLDMRGFRDGRFIGWAYTSPATKADSDASNTQYAMLALWYARQAGVKIDREVWVGIRNYYTDTQSKDGSWMYSPYYGLADKERPSASMTVAGLCGLQIASMELNGGREQWQLGGKFKNCGKYGDDLPLAKALHWLGKNFTVDLPERAYYHLYGLERAGRLTGQRFFGEHDWYREGCEYLVKKQNGDGSFKAYGGKESYDRWPHVNTAFALLFLSKGRTPVLISKVVHGEWKNGRNEQDTDWNNDRNDLRHLTEYIAKNSDVFGKSQKPLAWQTYDITRAREAHLTYKATGAEVDAAIVADMKQTPILYITGHESFNFRLTETETALIKRYVENGGFIVAEACCGSEDFDKSFKQWVKDVWEDDLKYLESTHPVWTCENNLKPGDPYKLMGLQVGCRTVMVYSPQDLSCYWESNHLDDGKAQAAFRLGVNIVAFGTDRTPPQPRLTQIDIAATANKMEAPVTEGAFRVAQIRHSSDSTAWQPAPKAMINLMEHVHKVDGLDVWLKPERIELGDKNDVMAAKFFYMHGRDEFHLKAGKAELDALRFTLEHGGLLFADACCGRKAFDKSFRKFMEELYPKEKLTRVPFEEKDRDPLFSAEFNKGVPLTAANIQCRTKPNGAMAPMAPMLEGIKIDGRWVVLYSPYDIGCALERHTSRDCVGYAPDSALRIAAAVVRYNARP